MMLARWFDDAFFPSLAFDLFRSLEDDFLPFNDRLSAPWGRAHSVTTPRVFAHETETEWTLIAEVPGVKQDDLQLSIQDGTLTMRGERHFSPPEGFKPRIQERAPMKFGYRVALPTHLDGDKAEAHLLDGILTVRVPKTPEAQPRRIAIKTT
jgi:HSP20 family protein